MQITVVGYQRSDFTTDSNQVFNGYNLFWLEPINPNYGEGYKASRGWVSSQNISGKLKVDSQAQLEFNRYGKIASVRFE